MVSLGPATGLSLQDSPMLKTLRVALPRYLLRPSYKQIGRPLLRPRPDGMRPGRDQAVADTGTQVNIIGSKMAPSLGVELGSLLGGD